MSKPGFAESLNIIRAILLSFGTELTFFVTARGTADVRVRTIILEDAITAFRRYSYGVIFDLSGNGRGRLIKPVGNVTKGKSFLNESFNSDTIL